jgi:hypothetical protein
MRGFSKVEGTPKARSSKCNLTPVVTYMGCQELKIGRRSSIVVLIWLEKEGRTRVRVVIACAENEYTGE